MRISATDASSWKNSIIGLIGKKKIVPLYLQTHWGIHTFAVREPIDILILDKNNVVKIVKKTLKPNRIFLWNPKYYRVLELPKETIVKKRIHIGEKIFVSFIS